MVIDHFQGGDGSPADFGSRTLRTPLPSAMAAIDPESLTLAYRDRIVAIACKTMGSDRVGVSRDGFAGRFLRGRSMLTKT